jgi:hypothetical protein
MVMWRLEDTAIPLVRLLEVAGASFGRVIGSDCDPWPDHYFINH